MFEPMLAGRIRRLFALLLVAALAIGPGIHGVQASDMAAKMSVADDAAGGVPMPSGCGGCTGDDDGMPMACSAICGSTISAILPTAPSVVPSPLASPTALFTTAVVDHHGPPDPYPPRPTSLG